MKAPRKGMDKYFLQGLGLVVAAGTVSILSLVFLPKWWAVGVITVALIVVGILALIEFRRPT